MKRIISFLALVLISTSAAHAKQRVPTLLQATSPWNMHYATSACELRRQFGEAEEQILFVIIQGPKFGILELMLFTPQIGKSRVYAKTKLAISSSNTVIDANATVYPSIEKGKSVWRIFGVSSDILTTETQDDVLRINVEKVANLSLHVGDLSGPAKAVETCQRDLLKNMGMDYDLLAQVKRFPQPKGNAGNWVGASDYPQPSFKQRLEGLTQFTLDVDARGEVQNCTILVSSGHSQLDQTTCIKLRERAKFEPALDQNDQPMEAPWISAVHWEVPK